MDESSDSSLPKSSDDNSSLVIVTGEPEIEGISLKSDEIALIETNLKDVDSCLANVREKMANPGFRFPIENEVKKIHLKVQECIAHLSTLNFMQVDMVGWERQVRKEMEKCVAKIEEEHTKRIEELKKNIVKRAKNLQWRSDGLQLKRSEPPGDSVAREEQIAFKDNTEEEKKRSVSNEF